MDCTLSVATDSISPICSWTSARRLSWGGAATEDVCHSTTSSPGRCLQWSQQKGLPRCRWARRKNVPLGPRGAPYRQFDNLNGTCINSKKYHGIYSYALMVVLNWTSFSSWWHICLTNAYMYIVMEQWKVDKSFCNPWCCCLFSRVTACNAFSFTLAAPRRKSTNKISAEVMEIWNF